MNIGLVIVLIIFTIFVTKWWLTPLNTPIGGTYGAPTGAVFTKPAASSGVTMYPYDTASAPTNASSAIVTLPPRIVYTAEVDENDELIRPLLQVNGQIVNNTKGIALFDNNTKPTAEWWTPAKAAQKYYIRVKFDVPAKLSYYNIDVKGGFNKVESYTSLDRDVSKRVKLPMSIIGSSNLNRLDALNGLGNDIAPDSMPYTDTIYFVIDVTNSNTFGGIRINLKL